MKTLTCCDVGTVASDWCCSCKLIEFLFDYKDYYATWYICVAPSIGSFTLVIYTCNPVLSFFSIQVLV